MKYTLDILLAAILLLLLFPIYLSVSLLILMRMGSPVLFRQIRPGLHGKPFELLKFRTMTNNTDKNEILLPDESRLTSLGNTLRRISLDELPQLFNVIKGEMSIIGPRPLLMEYLGRYTPEQARRHEVRPGITGWAQINGRNAITWEEKFQYDVWYVDNHSIVLDLKIILITLFKVLKGDGISQDGQVTTTPFMGPDN